MFLVKQGVPSDEELDWLSQKLENWKVVGRRLKIDTPTLTAFHMENRGWFEKSYRMLLHWKERNGSTATYTILHDALCHPLVKRTDLAEQLMTGNIPPILKFNKYTITYKDSAFNSQTLCFLATVSSAFVVDSTSQQESVASFVGNQIKAKEDHLMRLYIFM